jgi:hypothetical protein
MTDPAGRTTIIADASHCPRTRVAGWAAAAIVPGSMPRTETAPGGWFYASSSNSAEMTALTNAFAWAIEAGHVATGQSVLLVTDSSNAHNKLMGRPSRGARLRERRGLPPVLPLLGIPILRLAHDHGIILEVILADGHPTLDKRRISLRARTIHAVDRHSREIMKAERKRIFGRLDPAWSRGGFSLPQYGLRRPPPSPEPQEPQA